MSSNAKSIAAHVDRISDLRSRQVMKSLLRNYVNGEWVDTGRKYPNINPVDGSKVCDVSEADADTVDRAVKGARAAMNGDWGRLSAVDRAAMLHKVADRIEARFDDFLTAEVANTGYRLPFTS
jgi:aminomuconate-semialdehyde/2-hydroxymuconate-6-semialdehyde dehydrogenase